MLAASTALSNSHSIVELDRTVVSPAGTEKAAAGYRRFARRQQRSLVMRLFLPAPKLDSSVHNCTILKLHFCLDYITVKLTDPIHSLLPLGKCRAATLPPVSGIVMTPSTILVIAMNLIELVTTDKLRQNVSDASMFP